jgi:hypothetical protein
MLNSRVFILQHHHCLSHEMSPILDAERVKRLLHDVQQDVEQLEKGVCTNAEILQVRERVVSSARDIITAVEGPTQVVKNIAREVMYGAYLVFAVADAHSSIPSR